MCFYPRSKVHCTALSPLTSCPTWLWRELWPSCAKHSFNPKRGKYAETGENFLLGGWSAQKGNQDYKMFLQPSMSTQHGRTPPSCFVVAEWKQNLFNLSLLLLSISTRRSLNDLSARQVICKTLYFDPWVISIANFTSHWSIYFIWFDAHQCSQLDNLLLDIILPV